MLLQAYPKLDLSANSGSCSRRFLLTRALSWKKRFPLIKADRFHAVGTESGPSSLNNLE